MKVEDAARIIEAEASVLGYPGKLGVAQCIADNRFDKSCFTKPEYYFSLDSLHAAEAVMLHGEKRFSNAKILQFRSFTNYGINGEPDWQKIYGGQWPITDLAYIGKDGSGKYGHFYFGRWTCLKPFKLLVMAGHGRNVDGSFDPGACGCECREADLTRELTKLIKRSADAVGLPCDVAPDRNHFSFFKHGGLYDVTGYDYVLEVHFNASSQTDTWGDGKKKGSMIYKDKSQTDRQIEESILRNLYSVGSVKAWDGVVTTQRQASYANGLMVQNAVVRQGVSHAVLETCFITDMDDIKWYQQNKALIAMKIVEGIISGAKIADATPCYDWCGKGFATAEALEDMNVRESPNVYGTHAGLVREGQRVEVLEQLENGWYKVVWPGSIGGFAYTSNVNGKYYKWVN